MNKLNEDFTNLYKRWKSGKERKEDNRALNYINQREHPEWFNITEDGLVNCHGGNVTITQEDLINQELPCEFGEVSGSFGIWNCDIKTLKGCPRIVGEDFNISKCINLKSLEYSPEKVGVNIYLGDMNSLENLIGCTQDIGGSLKIDTSKKLKNISGAPTNINVDFTIQDCDELEDIKDLPKFIGGDLKINLCLKEFTKNDIPKDCKILGKTILN